MLISKTNSYLLLLIITRESYHKNLYGLLIISCILLKLLCNSPSYISQSIPESLLVSRDLISLYLNGAMDIRLLCGGPIRELPKKELLT